jgi:hypothetical protein
MHSFRQMRMPKTSVSEHGDRHSPRPAGAQTAQKQHAGSLEWTRNHPPPESVFPEGAARKVAASVRRACIPDTYAASGPNLEPGRILIPGEPFQIADYELLTAADDLSVAWCRITSSVR